MSRLSQGVVGDVNAPAAVASLVDALNGATFTGDTVTTSATPTVTELEAAVGVLAGKVNLILAALRGSGVIQT